MKFPLYLSKHFWENHQPYKSVITTACYVYSVSWIIISIVSYFIPDFEAAIRGNLMVFFVIIAVGLFIGIIRFLQKCIKSLSIRQKIKGRDISIEIRVDNIFNIRGAFVISTNSTFDTDMSNGLISKNSLQGQFTKKYYDKVVHLDHDLRKELDGKTYTLTNDDKIGKKKRYEIGTVVKIKPKEQVTYLVAVSHMNELGKAGDTSKEMMIDCLGNLWHQISEQGELEPLVVPVLGTGLARCLITREEMTREIINSFVAACSEKKFCKKLTIVIYEDDYREHGIDIQELGDYLRHHCEYTDFRNQSDTGKGIATN